MIFVLHIAIVSVISPKAVKVWKSELFHYQFYYFDLFFCGCYWTGVCVWVGGVLCVCGGVCVCVGRCVWGCVEGGIISTLHRPDILTSGGKSKTLLLFQCQNNWKVLA